VVAGVAGGSSTQVQYNSSGSLAGSANMVFDGSTLTTLNTAYTGTLTGGTGIVNLGSGQFYKDTSGNVGIGTSSPVNGANLTTLTVYNATQPALFLQNSTTGTTATDGLSIGMSGTDCYFNNRESGNIITYVNGSERMRIDTSGKVFVNTTSSVPGQSAWFTVVSTDLSALSGITLKNSGTTYGTGSQYLSFANSANTGAGSIQHTSLTTVAYATTSDKRLKENIVDAPSAINIANQIPVRSYDWKVDGKHIDYGFVAQELELYFPDAVCKGDDGETITDQKQTWQVDYGKITPLLLKAIQELNAKVDAQAATITTLQAKVGN
jgi:hypothetical protein